MADDMRAKALTIYEGILSKDMARRMERSVYNWCVSTAERQSIPRYWDNTVFRRMYCDKTRSMRFNLQNPQNPDLLRDVVTGEVDVKALPHMKPWELFPKLWVRTFEDVARMQLTRMAAETVLSDDYQSQVACKRCRERKVTWIELQTRAADEVRHESFHSAVRA